MGAVEQFMIQPGYVVGETLRSMHSYHLDELPVLWSATVVFYRIEQAAIPYLEETLPTPITQFFYGSTDRPIPRGVSLGGTLIDETVMTCPVA